MQEPELPVLLQNMTAAKHLEDLKLHPAEAATKGHTRRQQGAWKQRSRSWLL